MKPLFSPATAAALAAFGVLALAACSSNEGTAAAGPDAAATRSAAATTDDSAMAADPSSLPAATGTSASTATNAPDKTLTLQGLGDLVIGEPVPQGSGFAERGAQISDGCHTVSSRAYPGVYAITERGNVRRITLGERSGVKLVEGIGVGSSEAEVLEAFPGFGSTPHKYVEAPAKYLTQPGNDPRLRFEIGADGRISLVHVGIMPQLAYVEGCA